MRPGDPPRYAALLEDPGPLDPFGDADGYELAYRDRAEDVAFYVQLAAERPGSLLEIGCGSGRILLPIARSGREVWGIDRSAALLARLRADAGSLAVRARRADMRTFRLGRRFDVVLCTFNTVLHLTHRADLERFLRRVRAHLAPGGVFVFDALVPRAEDLARDPERWMRVRGVRDGDGRWWTQRERFAYEPLEQMLYVTTELAHGDERRVTLLAHRQWFPAELEMGLRYNGLRVEHVWADFGREEPALDADSLVWVCRAR